MSYNEDNDDGLIYFIYAMLLSIVWAILLTIIISI